MGSHKDREQWIDIMSRINWASLKMGDRRRLTEGEELELNWQKIQQGTQPFEGVQLEIEIDLPFNQKDHFTATVTQVVKEADTPTFVLQDERPPKIKNKCMLIGDTWQLRGIDTVNETQETRMKSATYLFSFIFLCNILFFCRVGLYDTNMVTLCFTEIYTLFFI